MGLFDRFRSAKPTADADNHKTDTSELDATRVIEEGQVLEAGGRLDEALQCYLEAIRLAPNPARAHLNHGNVLLLKGDLQGALNAFSAALKNKPDYAGAYYNIGNALLGNGQLDEAAANYRRALEIKPDYAEVHCSLGIALKELGQIDGAVACFQRALQINPDLVEARINLGNILHGQWKFEEATANYRYALEINPNYAEVHFGLGVTLKMQGRLTEADVSYRRALKIQPDNAMFRVVQTFTLPVAPQTAKISISVPDALDQSLRELSDWMCSSPTHPAQLSEVWNLQQPFYLAYRNGNHAALLSRYGDLMAASTFHMPITSLPNRKKIRLVVVSEHFRRHSVWDVILRGILANLDRTRFEIILYNMSHVEDAETKFAKSLCDIWRDFHTVFDFNGWLHGMATDQPDAIFYPEIGMDPMTLRLAGHRFAPLQMASWGHPITSGLPTIDLYFSGKMIEAPDADTHYRERLVRLPGTGCCTTPIKLTPEALPELEVELVKRRGVRFVIAQAPFKFDPADDALFARIAAAVGESTFILLDDPHYPWATKQLIARLNRAFRESELDPEQHLLVIPWLSREKFYALLDICDIYLDCPSFSGYTTAWQAVQRGLPVVTLEGQFMRQRLASGLLRKIGMTGTIATSADDYVAISVRLAAECRDPVRRDARHRALKDAAPLADNDVSVVRAFEQNIIEALAERGRHFEFEVAEQRTSLTSHPNKV